MSVADDINSAVQAAITANESGNLALAETKLRTARMLLAGIPDTTGKDTSLRWDRQFIEQLAQEVHAALRRTEFAGGRGVRRSNVTYRNARIGRCED